jgi:uncharacterized membrane protein
MLETALVFLVVISMLLFIIDVGRLLFLQQYFEERARFAARWAAVNTTDSTQVTNMTCYNSTTGSGVGFFGLAPSNVSVTTIDVNGQQFIKVTISGIQAVRFIPYIAGSFTMPVVSATELAQSLGATT